MEKKYNCGHVVTNGCCMRSGIPKIVLRIDLRTVPNQRSNSLEHSYLIGGFLFKFVSALVFH